jgi:hypothetical protein
MFCARGLKINDASTAQICTIPPPTINPGDIVAAMTAFVDKPASKDGASLPKRIVPANRTASQRTIVDSFNHPSSK